MTGRGKAFVYSGKDLLTFTANRKADGFGRHAAGVGDIDGDGHDDLIVGAWQYAGAAVSGGRASLFWRGRPADEDLHDAGRRAIRSGSIRSRWVTSTRTGRSTF